MEMKLALGPLLYYWQRETVLDFYEAIAKAPVDIVYLGKTVCSRRRELRLADWLSIAARLIEAGKEVVMSTQVLIESGSDVTTLHKIAEMSAQGDFMVEANDMGAVHCLEGKVPFVGGPHLNIYNVPTLQWMAPLGMQRWVMPLEMGRDDLALMQQGRPAGVQTEVFAYGRMPLAFSARCFTARHCNLPKDDCQFRCIEHPDGLLLRTREDEGFLVLNGIQTQSAKVYNLLPELGAMRDLGVDVVRVSPQAQHTPEILQLFHGVLTQQTPLDTAIKALAGLMPDQACNGYWYGKPGLEQLAAQPEHV
jgi:collagenase-like PrtC family protease